MSAGKEKLSRFNLLTSEDTYASQTSQNPATSRKLQSWIPVDDGTLTREAALPTFLTAPVPLSGPVVALFEYDFNDLNGNIIRLYFAAARTNFVAGTKTCNLYMSSGTSVPFALQTPIAVATGALFTSFFDIPSFVIINNILHVTDGAISLCYDGVSGLWFQEGFPVQTEPQAIDTATAGSLTLAVGRYYWISYADQRVTRNHEGDAVYGLSADGTTETPVVFTGPITNKQVKLYPFSGLASFVNGASLISLSASTDNPGPTAPPSVLFQDFASWALGVWINGQPLVDASGAPVFVTGFAPGVSLTVNAPISNATLANGRAVVAPLRTTHIHMYASEVDGSKVGQLLYQVPITQNLSTTPIIDSSPDTTSVTSLFLPIFRPVRNDPPPISRVLAVHKYRQWRVRNNKPTFFSFSGNEEIVSGSNGSPQESWPGTNVLTVSAAPVNGAAGDGNSHGSPAWSSPASVASSVVFATVPLSSTNINTGQSGPLNATTFPFSLPAGLTILGIQLSFDFKLNPAPTGGSIGLIDAALTKNGITSWLGGLRVPAGVSDSALHHVVLGGPTDLWDTTWQASDVNVNGANAGIGVSFQAILGGPAQTVQFAINNVKLTIYAQGEVGQGDTFSDIVNEYPYPDQSNRIRAMISHADALYMGSEKQILPLYGDSIDNFGISQVTAFAIGFAGLFSQISTPHGLLFMSYDRNVFLYPSGNYPWAYVPKDIDVTEQLIDIGRPQRKNFANIPSTRLNEVQATHYKYGIRDWGVFVYPDNSNAWHTYVYDFKSKGWFALQQGFSSIAKWEMSNGAQVLVGGGLDGNVYIADDLSDTFVNPAALPNAIWRPALIDFADPDSQRVVKSIELEFSSIALASDISVNYYLDPQDVDSPGTPRQVILHQLSIGSNRFRGFFLGGNTCHRILIEINAASSLNSGSIRGIKLVADKVTGLLN